MSNSPHETLLCRYHYDPLDRQSGCTLPQQPVIQRFHGDGRLTTEIQGGACWSILQYGDHLLAQRNHLEASVTATLLATDQQRSVLNALDASGPHPIAYTPYGHHPALHRLLSRRGFNGEQPDLLTGDYHLGNGYRQFNTVLMRFNSPDSWSPFGEGGLNAYGYCGGDPTNRVDPDGHVFKSVLGAVSKLFKSTQPEPRTTFEDLNQDIFHELSKYLSSQDMNNLRPTSKAIKPKIDQASEHNFKVYLKGNSPHIFNPHKSATPLDKTIQVGLGENPWHQQRRSNKTNQRRNGTNSLRHTYRFKLLLQPNQLYYGPIDLLYAPPENTNNLPSFYFLGKRVKNSSPG